MTDLLTMLTMLYLEQQHEEGLLLGVQIVQLKLSAGGGGRKQRKRRSQGRVGGGIGGKGGGGEMVAVATVE